MGEITHDIESEEFFELMQIYRHTNIEDQDAVCDHYRMVKKHISLFVERQIKRER